MTRLNAPREIPFAFRVVAYGDWVWLYDDSSRTYACSATASVLMEPLYPVEQSDDGHEYYCMPDAGYFDASSIESQQSYPVDVDPDYIATSTDEHDAWDAARATSVGMTMAVTMTARSILWMRARHSND